MSISGIAEGSDHSRYYYAGEDGDSISFLSNEYGSDSTVNISLFSSSLKALASAGYENADDGSGNVQLKSNGKDAVVTGGENLSDKTIRADGNRVYVVGNELDFQWIFY